MQSKHLTIIDNPAFSHARLLLGFSGWMDGGEVSTGTVEYLVDDLFAPELAEIASDEFYIYSFPGSMEFSALFRPYVHYKEGLMLDYEEPSNRFYYSQDHNLILFAGKEPHLKWPSYAECIFNVVEKFNVKEIYFIGSISGLVPHTRDPRFTCSVSNNKLKESLAEFNFKYTSYKGPSSITTYLMKLAAEKNIDMVNIIAEIPAYVQGRNPRCIDATLKRLAKILKLDIQLHTLLDLSDQMEKKLDKLVQEHEELADHIQKLEESYDQELFDTDMSDFKFWLKRQGIRLD
ncbi:MAG: PAC2 family protein [Sedimentisphaerales bacterium]|nr:PAC2 family protein [Sedimentisphaerales bacterium]